MKTPYEATVEIVVALLSQNDALNHGITDEGVAKFAQTIYDKMKELYEDETDLS